MMWICPQDAVTNYPLLNYQMELANLQKARERTEEFLPFEHVSRAPHCNYCDHALGCVGMLRFHV